MVAEIAAVTYVAVAFGTFSRMTDPHPEGVRPLYGDALVCSLLWPVLALFMAGAWCRRKVVRS